MSETSTLQTVSEPSIENREALAALEARAALHEAEAKKFYRRNDYHGTVRHLEECIRTGILQEHKDLRMRLLVMQTYRRWGEKEKARQWLNTLQERYGKSEEKYLQNLLLNEEEIMQGKEVLKSYPTRITVRPTNRCSVHCIMCTHWRAVPWDIPVERLEEVVSLYPYMEDILWQGGEVFEMKRELLWSILERSIPYKRICQNIITNGLHVDEAWAELLVAANVHMKLSIDGATAEVYERIRIGADFGNILKSVRNLNREMDRQNRRIWLSLHMVVQRPNYHQISQIVDFAREHRFDAVALSPMEGDLYRANDIFNYGDEAIWREVQRLRAEATEKALEYGIYLEDNLPPPPPPEDRSHPRNEKENEKRFSLYPMSEEEGKRYTGKGYDYFCLSPWKNLIVRNHGDVFPNWHCGEREIGNIHENTILELWNGARMQKVRRAVAKKEFGGVCRKFCLSDILIEPWKHHMEWWWS